MMIMMMMVMIMKTIVTDRDNSADGGHMTVSACQSGPPETKLLLLRTTFLFLCIKSLTVFGLKHIFLNMSVIFKTHSKLCTVFFTTKCSSMINFLFFGSLSDNRYVISPIKFSSRLLLYHIITIIVYRSTMTDRCKRYSSIDVLDILFIEEVFESRIFIRDANERRKDSEN